MSRQRFLLFFFVLYIGALFTISSFANTVYTSTRNVGTGIVDISITTDGIIGIIGTSNVLDWTISMTDGSDSFTLFGPLSGNNSVFAVGGDAFTATATDLLFNFDAAMHNWALFQNPWIGSGKTFYCIQTSDCFDFNGPAEAIDPRLDYSYTASARSGNYIIASVETLRPVPEPTSLLLLGTGVFGLAAWRRKKV
jgi:hypothetical protein